MQIKINHKPCCAEQGRELCPCLKDDIAELGATIGAHELEKEAIAKECGREIKNPLAKKILKILGVSDGRGGND